MNFWHINHYGARVEDDVDKNNQLQVSNGYSINNAY